ncbi:HTH_Tnp_Tc3_2 domain-containing protein [Trichonephila clavipes]|nr:HTH_Tnp_Tc3_2 domain-containing protein [Trichonephila clavipes]
MSNERYQEPLNHKRKQVGHVYRPPPRSEREQWKLPEHKMIAVQSEEWLEEPTSAIRRLPLTRPHHRQCRLDFCRPRATLECDRLRRVIFSDESRFSLSADDHRTHVWRRTGQRSDPAFIVEWHTAIS